MVATDSSGTSNKEEKVDYRVKDKDVVKMIQFVKEEELKKIENK